MPSLAPSGLPFDDIRSLLGAMPDLPPSRTTGKAWLAAVQQQQQATVARPVLAVFIARHASSLLALSAAAADADEVRLAALQQGTAPAARACAASGLGLKVFELALAHPAPDIFTATGLDEAACAATMAYGMEAVAGGCDVLGLAGFAVGGEVAAAALGQMLLGGDGGMWLSTPEGELRQHQLAALARLGGERLDPLEALRRFGGRETAALAGALLAARLNHVPVVIEGMAALAAAAVVHALRPDALAHVRLAAGPDKGAARLAERLGLEPLLAVDTTEATGLSAALALALLKTLAEVA
jgi:nicotinate-nucleotide--dimethylbenzimidazole phosphoribosyltransferase